MTIAILVTMANKHYEGRYAIRNRYGEWYCIDDRGVGVWSKWCLTEFATTDAEAVLASFARSTVRRCGLRIVEVKS